MSKTIKTEVIVGALERYYTELVTMEQARVAPPEYEAGIVRRTHLSAPELGEEKQLWAAIEAGEERLRSLQALHGLYKRHFEGSHTLGLSYGDRTRRQQLLGAIEALQEVLK